MSDRLDSIRVLTNEGRISNGGIGREPKAPGPIWHSFEKRRGRERERERESERERERGARGWRKG